MRRADLEDLDIYEVSVAVLDELANPLAEPPWPGLIWLDPIEPEEVLAAIASGDLVDFPVGRGVDGPFRGLDATGRRRLHVGRIAYLVVNPSEDPITIGVGVEGHSDHGVEILDGYHRLAAAMVAQRQFVLVTYDGSESLFLATFPTAIPLASAYPGRLQSLG